MNEMTDKQKLEVLVTVLKETCERLCQSQEQGITDLRYRLEDALTKCGIAPYTPYPIMVFESVCLQDSDGLKASEDESHYSRQGW